LQGRRFVPETEEEPGRILHEIRMDTTPSSSFAEGTVYYGTVDATPLFVVLLGELRRWGLERDAVAELLPAADRALEWIVDIGDRDGDGYVEYQRATPAGLANQGWKDSWDAIRFADGTLAEGPIALCEVQAYCYAAFLARAHFADEDGDDDLAAHWRDRAARLRDAFRRDFWIDDGGYVALALDGDKRPVDAVASNMGHCLWAGILDPLHAAQVARHLMSPAMFSGWGIRTLSTEMAAYDPLSYHNGSVWPHDNALITAGLVRYGHTEAAHRVMHALLEVSTHLDGRMPELFSGLSRDELGVPVPYPSSCIPQAWSAASPLLMLRSLLRLDPWYSHDAVWVAPELPAWIGRLRVEGIPYATDLISVEVDGGRVHIDGLSPQVHLIRAPRVALGDLGGRA
jgi:glycogen debranching enzyme